MILPKSLERYRKKIKRWEGIDDNENKYLIELNINFTFKSNNKKVESVKTVKEAIEKLKATTEREIKLGRPKGTKQEITRNKRLEIKTTSEVNAKIKELIREKKKKYNIKNSDEVLLKALKEL